MTLLRHKLVSDENGISVTVFLGDGYMNTVVSKDFPPEYGVKESLLSAYTEVYDYFSDLLQDASSIMDGLVKEADGDETEYPNEPLATWEKEILDGEVALSVDKITVNADRTGTAEVVDRSRIPQWLKSDQEIRLAAPDQEFTTATFDHVRMWAGSQGNGATIHFYNYGLPTRATEPAPDSGQGDMCHYCGNHDGNEVWCDCIGAQNARGFNRTPAASGGGTEADGDQGASYAGPDRVHKDTPAAETDAPHGPTLADTKFAVAEAFDAEADALWDSSPVTAKMLWRIASRLTDRGGR